MLLLAPSQRTKHRSIERSADSVGALARLSLNKLASVSGKPESEYSRAVLRSCSIIKISASLAHICPAVRLGGMAPHQMTKATRELHRMASDGTVLMKNPLFRQMRPSVALAVKPFELSGFEWA